VDTAPVLQLGDAASWEADWFGTEAFASHLAYWRDRLVDAPQTVTIESDRPRRDPPTFSGAQVTARIVADTVRALRELARSERGTLFMPALAAFILLLGRYQRSEDVVVGVPLAGRFRREFEDVVGLFVNTLAVRSDLSGGPTFRELLRRVRDTLLDAFAHQEVPFARIVEEMNPERNLTHTPLVQVLFQYLGGLGQGAAASGDQPELDGTVVTTVDLPNRYTELDMEVQLVDADGGLDLLWIYATDLYDGSTITAMAGEFVGLLAAVAAEPDRRIADFDVLTPDERQRFAELETTGPHLRVVDGNLQRCPFGVPGELVLTGTDLAAAALGRPSETAVRFVPDPFAAEPGGRMYATGDRAKHRRDGVIEILRPPQPTVHPGAAAPDTAGGSAQPRSETELALASIWAELLDVDQVGLDDDFFDLGGHSILAIRAIIALREKFACELPLRAIFDAPTVASMSRLLEAGGQPEDDAA
jgi:acyl carrier protein